MPEEQLGFLYDLCQKLNDDIDPSTGIDYTKVGLIWQEIVEKHLRRQFKSQEDILGIGSPVVSYR